MNVDNPTPSGEGVPSAPAQPSPAPAGRWWALATVAVGVSLIIMDATIVNVALPVIITDIGLTSTQAEWMNAVYSLMFAGLLLTVGRIGDLYGRRRLFGVGMSVFVVASIVAGASGSGAALISARLVQGVGAAMILPATLSTVNALYRGRERAVAFAVWGSTIGGMAAVGPLVGGWLTTNLSWRWAFWLSVPVGVLVLAGIVRYVPETKDERTPPGLDVLGVVLSAAGMGAIVFGLIEGQTYGWWRMDSGAVSPVPISLAAGLVFMAAFVATQYARARAGKVVLVDLRILSIRSFRYGSIAALIVALGEFGLIFTLPLLLQNALGYSAFGTGWLIFSLAVGTFLISAMTPQLTSRFGGRAVVRLGLAVEAVAVAGLALSLSADVKGWLIAAWLFAYGAGVGMATAQLTSVILAEVPVDESGQASGLQSTFRQLGSALGVAILGAVLLSTLGSTMRTNLANAGIPVAQSSSIVDAVTGSAGAAIPGLRREPATAAAGDAAAAAMIQASKVTTGGAAAAIALGLAATLALPFLPPTPRAPRTPRGERARRGRRPTTAAPSDRG